MTQTYSSDGGLQFVTSRGVGHVSTQKNDRFPKNLGTVKQLVDGVCGTHENKITSHTLQQSQASISRHVIISITLHQVIYIYMFMNTEETIKFFQKGISKIVINLKFSFGNLHVHLYFHFFITLVSLV